MHTRIIPATDRAIEDATTVIASHIPVAVPTETVYGLAARYDDEDAVKRIFEMKGRPADNPIIVHVATDEQFFDLVDAPEGYVKDLMEAFWPGPLTLVLRSAAAAPWTTGGLDTIAVRMPDHAWLQRLIRRTGPLAAPSANRSGRPSPTTAEHCLEDLRGTLPLIIDDGDAIHGVESTVVDCTQETPRILRPGAVSAERIAQVAGSASESGRSERSPGTRYRHYAPDATVEVSAEPRSRAQMYREAGKRTLLITDQPPEHEDDRQFLDRTHLARMLYGWLREADQLGAAYVITSSVAEGGIGSAIMNRLRKAAKRS